RVAKPALVIDRDMDLGDGPAFRHPAQDFLGDLGEERAGKDVVDVACAGLDFATAAGDAVDELIPIAERGVVVFAHSPADAAELKLDDLAHHSVGDRIEGDD